MLFGTITVMLLNDPLLWYFKSSDTTADANNANIDILR